MKSLKPIVGVAVLSSLLTALLVLWLSPRERIIIREAIPSQTAAVPIPITSVVTDVAVAGHPTSFVLAASKGKPAVVYIKTVHASKRSYWKYKYTSSSGSGVVITPDGYIVTNHHVIQDGSEIWVTLEDKREFRAEVIGNDPTTDLALLKIDASELPYLEFGDSDSVLVGEWVVAIGNPFRLESTVTAGIVSAKARNISILDSESSVESFIQTDAVVNQGNSGGALLNARGDLIGINAAIITQSGKYEGYSFAIPANLARKVITDLLEFGEVRRGLLGVSIRNLNSELARKMNLPEVAGVYIDYVNPSSAAKKAGLRSGDVIVAVNGTATRAFPELQELLARNRPGDELAIDYLRKGDRLTTTVVLQPKQVQKLEPLLMSYGFELRDLTDAEVLKFGGGAKVNSIYKDSRVEATHMDLDFIITSVNGQKVENTQEVLSALKSAESGKVELGGFYPQFEGRYFYSLDVPK